MQDKKIKSNVRKEMLQKYKKKKTFLQIYRWKTSFHRMIEIETISQKI